MTPGDRRITSIGRAIDPRYPTNRAILAIALAVSLVGSIARIATGAGPWLGVEWGGIAGVTVFMTWALGRELDPDHEYAAFVGTAVVLVITLATGLPHLLFSLWMLLALRIVNRSGGLPATGLDSFATMVVAFLVVYRGLWLAGPAMAAVFLADALLDPASRAQLHLAIVSLLGTLLLADRSSIGIATEVGLATVIVVGAACLFLVPVIGTSREIRAVGDRTGRPLQATRVRMAQVLALLVGTCAVVLQGREGWVASQPLWAAMLGVGLYRVPVLVVRGGSARGRRHR